MFKKKIIFILQLFCAVRYYVQYVFAGAQQTFGIGGLLGNSSKFFSPPPKHF